MNKIQTNAALVSIIFDELSKGNGKPFWDACHDKLVWRTIGSNSWSGEFYGKQTIIDQVLRPLNVVLAQRATVANRVIDGGDVVVVQAKGKNVARDGRRYDNDYVFVIHFAEGKIVLYEEYCDTELITEILGDRLVAKSSVKTA